MGSQQAASDAAAGGRGLQSRASLGTPTIRQRLTAKALLTAQSPVSVLWESPIQQGFVTERVPGILCLALAMTGTF